MNVMLSPSPCGGEFEYVPNSSEHFSLLKDTSPGGVEANMPCQVQRPLMHGGDLVLFAGRQSLHRVTPVTNGIRCNVIFAFVEQEGGGKLNDYTLEKFFGRRRQKIL